MYKLYIDEYFSSNSDQFSVYSSNPEDNDREHTHEFDELVVVENGHGLHVLNGKASYIQEGDVFYVRAGDYHFYDELGTLKLTNILINKEKEFQFLTNIDPLLNGLKNASSEAPSWLEPEHRAGIISLSKKLMPQTAIDESKYPAAYFESVFFQLITSIIYSLQHVRKSNSKYRLYELIRWLQENCLDEINWDEAEKKFLLTRRTLFRQIKETTGMTPDVFLKRLRLVTARALLKETELSVTEIAFQCGFSNSNHFSTCYKNAFGYSPSQERMKG